MSYVITGCASSGTMWAARVMQGLGSQCGHEAIYTPDGVFSRPDLEGDSSWMAIGRATNPQLLVVRDPLKVVQSLSQMTFLSGDRSYRYNQYCYSIRPGIGRGRDQLTRAIRYVGRWDSGLRDRVTLLVDKAGVDAVEYVFYMLTGRFTLLSSAEAEELLKQLGTKTNTHRRRWRPPSTLTYEDIAAHPDGGPVIDKAEYYGYL